MDDKKNKEGSRNLTRREFLTKGGKGLAVGSLGLWAVTNSDLTVLGQAKVDSISWLGWEHYNVEEITRRFEKKYGIKVEAGFFDANSQCYAKLKAGGTRDFDICMADGFWPKLYYNKGLTQAVNYDRLKYLDQLHADFLPPGFTNEKGVEGNQPLFVTDDGNYSAAPNCWGGYGYTYNTEKISYEEAHKVSALYNPDFAGHIIPSGRHQINIALTGILIGADNPWSLTDKQLQKCKEELIKQKDLILSRYHAVDNLERMLRSGVGWIGPEWSGVYRKLVMDGLPFNHALELKPAGLGWVDTWIPIANKSPAKLDAIYKWINWRMKPENMKIIMTEIGWSPTIDMKGLVSDKLYKLFFQDNTEAVHNLIMFQTPDRPEKWAKVWSDVEAA